MDTRGRSSGSRKTIIIAMIFFGAGLIFNIAIFILILISFGSRPVYITQDGSYIEIFALMLTEPAWTYNTAIIVASKSELNTDSFMGSPVSQIVKELDPASTEVAYETEPEEPTSKIRVFVEDQFADYPYFYYIVGTENREDDFLVQEVFIFDSLAPHHKTVRPWDDTRVHKYY